MATDFTGLGSIAWPKARIGRGSDSQDARAVAGWSGDPSRVWSESGRGIKFGVADMANALKTQRNLQGDSLVDTSDKSRQAFIEKLSEKNRLFYGSPDGLGLLKVIELGSAGRWVYLFELVQNALDAKASSISIQVIEAGNVLVFQHNGTRPIEEKDVEGLSKVFRSTKGARSVGFMGIGFKSVFMRFQEAIVSGWNWKFRFEIAQEKGEEYGDIQRQFLGAVVPKWDDAITPPGNGYTTRFELRQRTEEDKALASDISHLLPVEDRTLLAILAMSGLEKFEINGQIWELGSIRESEGNYKVEALTDYGNLLWRVFEAEFRPSRAAIACFLEHRRIKPEKEDRDQVYAEVTKARRVLGVLPLDNAGKPEPPRRGRVYATLPTEVTLPFGLHINADWLLDISRNGLREIEDNPWQQDIAREIGVVLALLLRWSADTHRDPTAARAVFKVLAQPSAEAGGLESLLAEEKWGSTLRKRIGKAAVIPVWSDTPNSLAFATARKTLVPPAPMAHAFLHQPDLRPEMLLKGRVLMEEVLGRGAAGLLRDIGLLSDMSPKELEEIWKDGLEDWWQVVSENPDHGRRQLFHLWAAIAKLSSNDDWGDLELRCVRSVAGDWVAIQQATFLSEPLPNEEEPGGLSALQLMKPHVADGNRLDTEWVASLSQGKSHVSDREVHVAAWAWIEEHARKLNLQDVAKAALEDLDSQTETDWSVLVPFGQWAKHRNQPDLLYRVLVVSEDGEFSVSIEDSLVADPYVGHGRELRRIWRDQLAISPSYLETDPKGGSPQEWRMFLENAGAKGSLAVKSNEAKVGQWEREAVVKFLGPDASDIPDPNHNGYTLLDFDIEPLLPNSGASRELRSAIAAWLEDGFRTLKDKGRRKVGWTYYSDRERTGNSSSAWVKRLSQIEWVPCDDGKLRLPGHTLPQYDAAREEAPFAKLSPELVSMLDQEGVEFGTEIPEATSLNRLAKTGSDLDSEALSVLLADCRKEIATAVDGEMLKEELSRLTVPTVDNRRVKLDRLVKRTGGRLRGTLSGWVVPLDQIEEALRAELAHVDFPWDIPETTTGSQALDYILHVWDRAKNSPDGLANEVRDVLPTAYVYCLDDSENDSRLLARWQSGVLRAMVFADREWLNLADTMDVYLDDIDDRRFLPRQGEFRTVTGGHLGRSREQQLRVAKAIELRTLSSCITMDWGSGKPLQVPAEWESRFGLVYQLVLAVRGGESKDDDSEEPSVVAQSRPVLLHVDELPLGVGIGNAPVEVVPVNARLHEGSLTVAGRPLQFGADAAKELLRDFSFGQRAGLAADLTGILTAIDKDDFSLAVEKFHRSHAPALVLDGALELGAAADGSEGFEIVSDEDHEILSQDINGDTQGDMQGSEASTVGGGSDVDSPTSGGELPDVANDGGGEGSVEEDLVEPGGSYGKDRALAKQNVLAQQLRRSLKGEIVPDSFEGVTGEDTMTNELDDDEGRLLGDEEYREAAAQYEREAGREPELGDPFQAGWDIRSTDPETQQVRLIEVKGRGRPWDGDEVVELSGAQIRKAFETGSSWYLYVVEKTDEGRHRVLPIENPVRLAAKWILCGESWRMVAESSEGFGNDAESVGGTEN